MRTSFVLRQVLAAALLGGCVLAAGCHETALPTTRPTPAAVPQTRPTTAPAVEGLPATVRLVELRGWSTVSGRINGERFRFVIDTGAAICILTPEAARRAGLSVSEDASSVTSDAQGVCRNLPTATADTLCLQQAGKRQRRGSPVVFRAVEFLVGDSPALTDGIDGIIGLPLLEQGVFRFDAERGRLTIRDGELAAGDSLPLRRSGDLLQLLLNADSREVRLTLDSGDAGTLCLRQSVADQLGYASPPRVSGVSYNFSSIGEASTARLACDLTFGGVRLVRPIVTLVPDDEGHETTLGNGVFWTLVWELDARNGRLRIVDPPTEPITMGAEIALGFELSPDIDTIGWLLPGGNAAAAGLLVGDEVLSVAGLSADAIRRIAIPDVGDDEPFPVVVRRDGRELTFDIKITQLHAEPTTLPATCPASAMTAASP